jgi:hypothetical protein
VEHRQTVDDQYRQLLLAENANYERRACELFRVDRDDTYTGLVSDVGAKQLKRSVTMPSLKELEPTFVTLSGTKYYSIEALYKLIQH